MNAGWKARPFSYQQSSAILLSNSRQEAYVVKLAVELADVRAQLERLIQEVESGAEVLITHNGQPVARLVAPGEATPPDRVPGSAKGLFTVPDDFDAPLDDFRDYM
jgi:prevent-host-death family protein